MTKKQIINIINESGLAADAKQIFIERVNQSGDSNDQLLEDLARALDLQADAFEVEENLATQKSATYKKAAEDLQKTMSDADANAQTVLQDAMTQIDQLSQPAQASGVPSTPPIDTLSTPPTAPAM